MENIIEKYNHLIMNIKKLLGKRIKAIREAHNLTQEKLAEELNMSSMSLSKVERGLNFISPSLLEKLCKFYNVEADYFFKFNAGAPNNDFEKLDSIIKKLKSLDSTDLSYVCKFINGL